MKIYQEMKNKISQIDKNWHQTPQFYNYFTLLNKAWPWRMSDLVYFLITIIVFTDLTRTTNVGRNVRHTFYPNTLYNITLYKNSLSNAIGKYILASAFLWRMWLLDVILWCNCAMKLYDTRWFLSRTWRNATLKLTLIYNSGWEIN